MLITEVTEHVVTQINGMDPALDIPAIPCIDFITAIGDNGLKILVVPEVTQYTITPENSREYIKQKNAVHYISVLVGFTFEGILELDTVAPWEDAKIIYDIRQKIDEHLMNIDWSSLKLALADIESQPVDEQELDRRNFNASTTFGFEDLTCGTGLSPASTLLTSNDNISQQRERVLLRRAALSEKRLGRRSE